MDPLLLGGLIVTILAILGAMLLDGNALGALLSSSALLLVLGGSLGASLMGAQLDDLKRVPRAMLVALRGKAIDAEASLLTLVDAAEIARKEGVLALEQRIAELEDAFLAEGLQLVIDGHDGQQLRERLQIHLEALEERHRCAQSFFRNLGGFSPTIGMIGTVIGLVNMLQALDDPSQLGLGMAMALLTTLYGVLFANLLFLPFAAKLERLHEKELRAREIIAEGICAVQAGASPRLLVERLEGYLPPDRRLGYDDRMAERAEQEAAAAATQQDVAA